ncbi:MAG: hypothetical protein H6563_07545 [Lewinellaceae bacterium]|nr:hypothetical protein [Lewinellaceae bacterium]
MTPKKFQLQIQLLNQEDQPITRHRLEAWDLDQGKQDDFLGEATTNEEGKCTIRFGLDRANDRGEKRPDVYFKVFDGEKLIYNTREDVIYWGLNVSKLDVVIRIPGEGVTFPVPNVPIKIQDLKTELGNLGTIGFSTKAYIENRLNNNLKDRIKGQLPIDGPSVERFLEKLDIDFRVWQDRSLKEVVEELVVPELQKDEVLNKQFSGAVAAENIIETTNLSELLQLDLPLKEHPLFSEEVRRIKNYTIAHIAGLPDETADAIHSQGVKWEDATQNQWDALEEKGIISGEEKTGLQKAFGFSKITGNNFALTKILAEEKNIITPKDLAQLEREDWQRVLEKAGNEVPGKESPEEYVDNIILTVQRNFPSHFLLLRAVNTDKKRFEPAKKLTRLYKLNPELIKDGKANNVNWGNISGEDQKTLKVELDALKRLSNTYRYLGTEKVINDSSLTPAQKAKALGDKVALLNTFYENNENFDLKRAQLLSKAELEENLNWRDIPAEEQDGVKQQLRAYQRTLFLATSPEISQSLLEEGFDSAHSIANLTQKQFEKQSGLEPQLALAVYQNAQDTKIWVTQIESAFREIQWNLNYGINVDNTAIPALWNDLKDIDGYDDLFGSQNYCDCPPCRSVLSPSAYFVDLMYFIEKNILDNIDATQHDHPLFLKRRRPDLWNCPLTCENTFKMQPTLNIVNHILQAFLEEVTGSSDIYEFLKSQNISFHLPFNLPFEELKIYLKHFKLKLFDLYKTAHADANEIQLSYLELSAEEKKIIVTNATSARKRYGDPDNLDKMNVSDFMKYTRLDRKQVGTLIKLDFITNAQTIHIEKVPVDNDIQRFEEFLVDLTDEVLVRIHRLIRLWYKLPWSLKELDILVKSLKAAGIGDDAANPLNTELLRGIARLRIIQDNLELSTEELCGIVHQIPDTSVRSKTQTVPFSEEKYEEAVPGLFIRSFNPDELFGQNQTQCDFYHPEFDSGGNPNPPDAKMPILIGGLGVTESELLELFVFMNSELGFGSNGICTLNKEKVSHLWRHAAVAKGLKLTIAEFIKLVKLSVTGQGTSFLSNLDQVERIIRVHQSIEDSPFNIEETRFILLGEESQDTIYETTNEQIVGQVRRVQEAGLLLMDHRDLTAINGIPEKEANDLVAELANQSVLSYDANRKKYFFPNSTRLTETELDSFISTILNPATQQIFSDKKTKLLAQSNQHHFSEMVRFSLGNVYNKPPKYVAELESFVQADITDVSFLNGLSTELTEEGEVVSPPDLESLLHLFNETDRLALLFGTLKMEETHLEFIATNPNLFGISDVKNLKLEDIFSLVKYKSWLDKKEEGPKRIHTLLSAFGMGALADSEFEMISDLTELDKTLVQSTYNALSLPGIAIEALEKTRAASEVNMVLGVHGHFFSKVFSTDYADLALGRDMLLAAFKAKYSKEEEWEKIYEPYLDKLNGIKRDALCGYILSNEEEYKFSDTNEIYAFLLIDPEISGCARISKVKALTLSAQLFVHRVIMNLEQSQDGTFRAFLPPAAARQWIWRKNYRVWEANRKVFLWPENWIEPELRDNKSPIFEELEDEILQEKITEPAAEKAYKIYLNKLLDHSKLTIAGTYFQRAGASTPFPTYHLFGKMPTDPPIYYYRKLFVLPDENGDLTVKDWTPWKKVKLTINSPWVSPYFYLGKLFLFWIDFSSREISKFEGGTSEFERVKHNISFNYSYLDDTGEWIQPQRIDDWYGDNGDRDNDQIEYFRNLKTNKRIFPVLQQDKLFFYYLRKNSNDNHYGRYLFLDLFSNKLIDNTNMRSGWPENLDTVVLGRQPMSDNFQLKIQGSDNLIFSLNPFNEADIEFFSTRGENPWAQPLTNFFLRPINFKLDLRQVHNARNESVFLYGDQQFLIRKLDDSLEMTRLTTSLAYPLGEKLFNVGLDQFLQLETQYEFKEPPLGLIYTSTPQQTLFGPEENNDQLDFNGAYGLYYRELFFHAPFLLADHLNANQNFAEAQKWYHYIFNPIITEDPEPTPSTDKNWRFSEFRGLGWPRLIEILNDPAAIEQYKNDPFNPHAIARLRLSAYQKSIVMKYVDNLLDWGDKLFGQDSFESINEALMLYILASDIMGKRPKQIGECEGLEESKMTYAQLRPAIDNGSEILLWYENIRFIPFKTKPSPNYGGGNLANRVGSATLARGVRGTEAYHAIQWEYNREPISQNAGNYDRVPNQQANFQYQVVGEWVKVDKTQVFCVPHNKRLMAIYDRIEDRLFKIRNCMNLSGVRRQLALFQPSIDPGALVAARGAGLSLEDILSGLDAPLPPYRFQYLIQKAKEFTGTVQALGGALLSALEKKDVEELNLLQNVHQLTLQNLTTKLKKQQIEENKAQINNLKETKKNVDNRINYYTGLIDKGLIPWERTEQIATHTSSILYGVESIMAVLSGVFGLLPDIGAPTAMKYGGTQVKEAPEKQAIAFDALAQASNVLARSAGIEANFQRREQDWKQQLKLAEQEIKAIDQQIIAAEIRLQISERDLEIQEKNIDQTKEIYDFYKGKFTKLGLYNYLATNLSQLYRSAYTMALDMAQKAERAYQYELDLNDFFIQNDNWDSGNAGFLAGERLNIQLHQLEKAFIENNVRRDEITQSFSLRGLAPEQITLLQEQGQCTFTIPEVAFDLFYPGHLNRKITNVRLSVPCVTGPYTNVSCRLNLTSSQIRIDGATKVAGPSYAHTAVSTSSGNNDGGQFELNFRDERYLPFEGAGAESTWSLQLPSAFRPFDYRTINDVIIHISYTAKYDETYRTNVEDKISGTIKDYLTNTGYYVLFSMKQHFQNELYRMQSDASVTSVDVKVKREYLPYVISQHDIQLDGTVVIKEPITDTDSPPLSEIPAANKYSITPTVVADIDGKVIAWEMPIDESFINEETGEALILMHFKLQ